MITPKFFCLLGWHVLYRRVSGPTGGLNIRGVRLIVRRHLFQSMHTSACVFTSISAHLQVRTFNQSVFQLSQPREPRCRTTPKPCDFAYALNQYKGSALIACTCVWRLPSVQKACIHKKTCQTDQSSCLLERAHYQWLYSVSIFTGMTATLSRSYVASNRHALAALQHGSTWRTADRCPGSSCTPQVTGLKPPHTAYTAQIYRLYLIHGKFYSALIGHAPTEPEWQAFS